MMATAALNLTDQLAGASASKKQIERTIAQTGLGVVRALRESTMSIEDAEHDLFNLATYRAMRKRRLSPKLIEFMQWGMELEDVASLAKDSLEDSYQAMERLLLQCLSAAIGRPNGKHHPRNSS